MSPRSAGGGRQARGSAGVWSILAVSDQWIGHGVPLSLRFGGYSFDVVIELLPDKAVAAGVAQPVSGARASAYCE